MITWFEAFIITVVLLNAIFLACGDPTAPSDSPRNRAVDTADKVFLGIYTVELVLKVLALGLILHKGAYLRNGWNWVDFIILLVNWVMLLVELSGAETANVASVVRVVRVFRTLRLLSAIPKLRRIVATLILSIPYVVNVLGLLCLFFLLFGIPSVVLFGGQLRKHCVVTSSETNSSSSMEVFFDADITCVRDDTVVGGLECDEVEGLEEATCQETNTNPAFGTVSFDNFLIATINLFQCTMMEEWTATMYLVMDATNYFAGLFFLVVVFIGAFFIINLFLGIVESTYHGLGEGEQQSNQKNEKREQTPQNQPTKGRGGDTERVGGRDIAAKRVSPREVEMRTFRDEAEGEEDLRIEDSDEDESLNAAEREEEPERQPREDRSGEHDQDKELRSSELYQTEQHNTCSLGKNTKPNGTKGTQLVRACHRKWQCLCNWLKRPSANEWNQLDGHSFPHWTTLRRMYYSGATWVDRRVANTRWFEVAIMCLIVLNTVILAMVFKDQPDSYTHFLFIANIVLNSLFTVEIFIRLYALGLWKYLTKSGFNLFDCVVVIIGWVEIVLVVLADRSTPGVTTLRALRLLRTLRFVRFWDSLNQLVKTIGRVISSLVYNLLLLVVLIFIFAVMGMYLFGGKFDFPGEEKPRLHFDSFFWSFMTVFQLISGTDWVFAMRDAIRATSWAASVYFIAMLTISSFLVLNLFLSILLGSFDLTSNQAQADRTNNQSGQEPSHTDKKEAATNLANEKEEADERQEQESIPDKISKKDSDEESEEEWLDSNGSDAETSSAQQQNKVVLRIGLTNEEEQGNAFSIAVSVEEADKSATAQVRENRREQRIQKRLAHKSLFGIAPDNTVRIFCLRLTTHPHFETAIGIAIMVSCISLAVELHFDGDVPFAVFLSLDITLAVIFLIEMLMKWVGQGLFAHRYAYFRSGWNVMDALVVFVSVVSLLLMPVGTDLAFLRALRAFRPIRLLIRFTPTRVVLKAMMRTLPVLPSLLCISGFIWIIFAILGLQLFVGKFDYCNDSSVSSKAQCLGNYTTEDGVVEEREWLTPNDNFDNFGEALFTVFKMASLENFQTVLFQAVDITGEDEQPQRDVSAYNVWYFLAYIPMCCWLVLGLFTGGIIDQFSKTRLEESFKGTVFLTEQQREWIQLQQLIMKLGIKRNIQKPKLKARRWLYDIVTRPAFEYFIAAVIFSNICVLVTYHYEQPQAFTDFQFIMDIIFTVIYVMEAGAKIAAWFPKRYFGDWWNILDFAIVLLSIVSLCLAAFPSLAAIRVLRILRVLKSFKVIKPLYVLFTALVYSLPAMANVGLVLFILFYIFSILGMALFSDITTGEQLNDNIVNFKNFYFAFLLVCRMATGEDWNGIMHDVMNVKGPWSLIYFAVFNVLVFFIGVQLFVAVVIENFRFVTDLEQKGSVSLMDLDSFSKLWGEFDPDRTETLPVEHLPIFLQQLSKPLGLVDKHTATRNMSSSNQLFDIDPMDIGVDSVDEESIHFSDLLLVLVQRAFGKEEAQLVIVTNKMPKKKASMTFNKHETNERHCINGAKLAQYVNAIEQLYYEKQTVFTQESIQEEAKLISNRKQWWIFQCICCKEVNKSK
ncbi:Voltage-dependent calcium channel type A subunit alpha-1 [Balamuthia mandrillaris]